MSSGPKLQKYHKSKGLQPWGATCSKTTHSTMHKYSYLHLNLHNTCIDVHLYFHLFLGPRSKTKVYLGGCGSVKPQRQVFAFRSKPSRYDRTRNKSWWTPWRVCFDLDKSKETKSLRIGNFILPGLAISIITHFMNLVSEARNFIFLRIWHNIVTFG